MDTPVTAAAPAAATTAAPKTAANRSIRARAQMNQQAREQTAPASASASATATVTPAPAPAPREATPPAGAVPVEPSAAAAAVTTLPNPEPAPATDANAAPPPADAAAAAPAEPELLATLEEELPLLAEDMGGRGRPEWLEEILADPDLPKVKKDLIKRIHTLADQRDAERNARLELERERATQAAPPEVDSAAIAPDPVQAHATVRAIDGQLSQVLSALEMLDRHPEGGPIMRPNGEPLTNDKGQPVELSADDVRRHRLHYNNQLARLNAERATAVLALRQDLGSRQVEATRQARAAYPWMTDPQAPEYQTALEVLRNFPGVRANPEWPLVVGRYVTGLMAEQATSNKTALGPRPAPMTRPKGGTTPPPVAAQRSVAPAPVDPWQKQVQEAREEYRKSPTVKNRSKLFALERQQRTAA
jgi:hypothetical protein